MPAQASYSQDLHGSLDTFDFGRFGLFGIEPEYHGQVDGILKDLLAA